MPRMWRPSDRPALHAQEGMPVRATETIQSGMTRVCSLCKTDKPLSEFYKQTKRNGHMSYCKLCTRKEAKKWTVINAVRVRSRFKEYKSQHREHYRELHRAYLARIKADPERRAAYLARKRELYRQKRLYLPAPSSIIGARRREVDGYVTPRRINKLNKVIAKVIPAVHFTAEKLPDNNETL